MRSDVLWEGLARIARERPLRLFGLAGALLQGQVAFKERVAALADLDPDALPYNQELISMIRRERAMGRTTVLATGACAESALSIASHLGVFDMVLASDGKRNLSGSEKARALTEYFTRGGFDYAGHARSDIDVFAAARRAIVVNAGPNVQREAGRLPDAEFGLAAPQPVAPAILRELRMGQWAKNLLLFLPLLLAHHFLDARALLHVAVAFIAFSLCASGVYVINDILDLDADRKHPVKRLRPFASGELPVNFAYLSPALICLAFTFTIFVSPAFVVALAAYLFLSLSYSWSLKSVALIDILALASLNTVRLVAGAVAAGVAVSFWLLAVSLFLFSGLAMLKRFSELRSMRTGAVTDSPADYRSGDSQIIAMLGIASGLVSVLAVALYINADVAKRMYHYPGLLWAICPLMLYWLGRIWLTANRGEMNEDPIVFSVRDGPSLLVGGLALLIGIAACLPAHLPH